MRLCLAFVCNLLDSKALSVAFRLFFFYIFLLPNYFNPRITHTVRIALYDMFCYKDCLNATSKSQVDVYILSLASLSSCR